LDKLKLSLSQFSFNQSTDYVATFVILNHPFQLHTLPDSSTPGGAAMNVLRLLIRTLGIVAVSWRFIKSVWLVLRQY
jgi:hypothetical protein